MLSYFYDPSMFIYRWSSNFVKKLGWKREHGDRDAVPLTLCITFLHMEETITTVRLNIKDNNK